MQNVGQVTGKKRVNVAAQNCKNKSSAAGGGGSGTTSSGSKNTNVVVGGGGAATKATASVAAAAAAPPTTTKPLHSTSVSGKAQPATAAVHAPRANESESDEESVSEVDSFPIDRTFEIESEGENDEESEDPEEDDDESEEPEDEEDEDCEDAESDESEDPDEEDEEAAELAAAAAAAGGDAGAATGGPAGATAAANNVANGSGKNYGKKYMLKCDELDIPMQSNNTKARLEALLEAADEAAQALHRMRSDSIPRDKNLLSRSLIAACTDNDVNAVRRLLGESNSTINEGTDDGESLLSLACSAGYYELAQVLLAMNAHVEDRGQKNDTTPLMEAASAGHVDIIRLLINHGADVNALSSTGNSPLMYACAAGHVDAVSELLESGAHVEDHNENGHTPLMEAASAGHVEVAKILLEHGAGINRHSNEFKESALTLACYKGHLEMVRFLLAAGADQEHKTDEMHTALMEASMDGHVEVARLLLDSGAQVNMPTDSFESPLTLAACGGHTQLALLLIERGANIEEVNDESYTPLMEAAREGHEEMVALLLTRGANINAQTEETQETALTLACCGGFLDVAAYLLRNGADIELGASTPLMEAAQEGHIELVKFLLENGADVHAQTQTGDTALTYACENGHTDVAEVLLSYNAKLEHESEGGRTPLMKACRAGHICTVKFLINKGAMVNRATTNNDHTPLSLSCAGGHQTVVELLLKSGADPFHRLKDNSTMLIEAAKGGHIDVVRLLLDYPSSVVQVDLGVLPATATNVLNTQMLLPQDQLTQTQQQQLATQQQLIAIQQQAQLALQQQQQMLVAPPGLQDVPEAVRANSHQLLQHHQFPQVKDSSCILKNMSELLNNPPDPILTEIMQMQAGFKDGLALGLNKGQPEMVNHLINNLSNSLVQHQYQLATHQQALQRTMLDPNLLAAAAGDLSQQLDMQQQQQQLQQKGGASVLRTSKNNNNGQQQFVLGSVDGRSNLNISSAESQQVRSEPLGEDVCCGDGGDGHAQEYYQQQQQLGATATAIAEDMQKQEKLLEYQIANYDNTQFKLMCDGILPPELYVDIQAGEDQGEKSDVTNVPGAGATSVVPIMPLQQQQQQQQPETPLTTPAEVSQNTAISSRPKVKPVSKKDGKNANRKAQLAAAAAAAAQQASMQGGGCMGTVASTSDTGQQQSSGVVMAQCPEQQQQQLLQQQQQQQQLQPFAQLPGAPLDQQQQQMVLGQQQTQTASVAQMHYHENYWNDLQQQMQSYRQRLEKHQQLQHQLQQHQATSNQQQQQQQQPQSQPAQTIDISTVNKIMNFLAGPHASVIQQLQQQQQQSCGGEGGGGGICAMDPAGQDLSAMAHDEQQQQLQLQQQQSEEDQILGQEPQVMMEGDRVGAQGESEDDEDAGLEEDEDDEEDDEEEEEDELAAAKETTDADSQTQNLSSSSESDEQLNPQWDEKMWRKVAHRPNHPFQKKAQQVTQQKALGEEESIDNDTIAEFLRVLCGLPTDNPISYIPALMQLQKQPGGKPQKLENILNETIQQFEDGGFSITSAQLDQLHMLGLDDSDRETIPDCEIYPHMLSELNDQTDPNMTRQETADLFANIIGMGSSCKHRWDDADPELTNIPSTTLHAANHAQHLEPGGATGLTLQQQQLQLLATSLADATKTKTDELLDQLLADKQQLQQQHQQLQQQHQQCSKMALRFQDAAQANASYVESLKQIQDFKQRQEQQQNMLSMLSGQMQIDLNNPNCRYAAAAAAAAAAGGQPAGGVVTGQQYQQVGIPQQQQQQLDLTVNNGGGGVGGVAPPLSVLQPHQLLPKTNHQPDLFQQQQQQQCYQHSQATQTKSRADGQESAANNKRGANGKLERLQQQQLQGQTNFNASDFVPQQQQNVQGAGKNNGLVSMVPNQLQQQQQQMGQMPGVNQQPQAHQKTVNNNQQQQQQTTAGAATTTTTSKKSGSRKNKQCLGNRHQPILDSEFDCNFDDVDLFGQPFPAAQTPNDKIIDVDSETDSNHDTALTLACAGGHDELVKLLLSRGANIEHRDKKGFTPLILAATAGHTKVVEVLLQYGADMEAQSERTKDTPLSLACSGGRYDVVELLLNVGANKEHRNVSDYTPLSLAASGGYVNIIKLLLQKGAEINSRTGSKLGISPLMLAAMNGHTPAVKLLLDMGSDINAQIETNRNTALTLACFQGRHEVVSLLLDRKANVEHRAKTGLTPLMEAASGGYIEVGRVLLDKGADVNAAPVPSSRDTALTIAADKGHLKFVELLLYRGASVEVKNKKGNSPLWLAANGGHLPVVEILYNHDADIDSQDNRKVSCLMAAFRKGHTKVVKWMVNHVAQFPSDQEMTRYISTVSDKELLEKCNECVKVIQAAKEAQDLKAYKNASILLEELYLEKTREESRKAAAARRREKKKKKKLEKKEEKRKMFESKPSEERDDDEDSDNNNEEADEEEDSVPEMLNHDREEGDSGIDANSQGSCSSAEATKGGKGGGKEEGKKSKAAKKKEKANQQQEKEKARKVESPPIAAPPTVAVQQPAGGKTKQPAATIDQKKNEKNKLQDSTLVTPTSAKKVNASEKENVMPKEDPKSHGKVSVTGQKTAIESKQQKENNKSTQQEEKKADQHGVGYNANRVEDMSSFLLMATQQQQKNVKANQKVDDQKAKHQQSHMTQQTAQSHSSGSTMGTGVGAPGQNQQQPMKKGDEGWKEVVRKSSVQQNQQQPPTGSNSSSAGGAGGGSASPEVNCKKIQVPMNAISRVIGRAGSNINAIRASTGAHIEVEKQGKSQSDRLITIKGSGEATKQAHQLIATLIKDPDVDILQVLAKVCSGSGSGTSTPANVGATIANTATVTASIPKPVVPTGVSVWGNPPTGPAPKIAPDLPTSGPSSPSPMGKQGMATKPGTGFGPSASQQNLGKTNVGPFGKATPTSSGGSGIVKPTPHGHGNLANPLNRSHQIGGPGNNTNNNNNNNHLRNGGTLNSGHLKSGGNVSSSSVGGGQQQTQQQQHIQMKIYPPIAPTHRSKPGLMIDQQIAPGAGGGQHSVANKRPGPGSFAAKLQSPAPSQGGDGKNSSVGSGGNVQLSPKHHSGGYGGQQQQHQHHHHQQTQQHQQGYHQHGGHHGGGQQQHHGSTSSAQSNSTSSSNLNQNRGDGNVYQPTSSPSMLSGYNTTSSSSAIGSGRPQFGNNNSADDRTISPISQLARNVSPSPLLMSSPHIPEMMGLNVAVNNSPLGILGKQLQIQANSAHIYSLFNDGPKWEATASVEPKVDVTKAPGYRVNAATSSPGSSKAGSSQSITPPAAGAQSAPGSERSSASGQSGQAQQHQQQQQQQQSGPGSVGSGASSSGGNSGSSTGMLGVNVGPIGSAPGGNSMKGAQNSSNSGGNSGMAVQRPGMRSPRYSAVDPIGSMSSGGQSVGSGGPVNRNHASYFGDMSVGHMMNDYGPPPPQMQSPYQQQQQQQGQQQQQQNQPPGGGNSNPHHGMNAMQQNQARMNQRGNSFAGGNNNSGGQQQQQQQANSGNKGYAQQPPPIGSGAGGNSSGNQQQSPQQANQSIMPQYSKMNNPYNRSGMVQGGGGGNSGGPSTGGGGGGYGRWYDMDGPLSGGSASSSGGNNSGGGGGGGNMMGITNGLAGLGLAGSPSSMSPNKGQGPTGQIQQGPGQQPPHHVNSSETVGLGDDVRKILRAIGTERSWKYSGYGGGAPGPIGVVQSPPTSGGPMGAGGQIDADQMALWMMLDKVTGGAGGVGGGGGGGGAGGVGPVGSNPQMAPMHGSWMSHNNSNANKSRPSPFMQNPEADMHLQDPYNFQMEYLHQPPFMPYNMSFPHSDLPPPGAGGPPMSDKGTDQWGDPHDSKHAWGASKWTN